MLTLLLQLQTYIRFSLDHSSLGWGIEWVLEMKIYQLCARPQQQARNSKLCIFFYYTPKQ